MKFQRAYGLPVTGIFNTAVINKLSGLTYSQYPHLSGYNLTQIGQYGGMFQQLGYNIYNQSSIMNFQRAYGLSVNGMLGTGVFNQLSNVMISKYPHLRGYSVSQIGQYGSMFQQLGYNIYSQSSIMNFQRTYGLSVNGMLGTSVFNQLNTLCM